MDTTNDNADLDGQRSTSPDSLWSQRSSNIVLALAAGALLVGTVMYRWLEDWSWVDSLYFSVITLTTVGYGDLSPSTTASKLFTVIYVITGISLIAACLNEVMKRRARRAASRRSRV